MHELAITQQILDVCLQTARQQGAKRIQSITICYGPYAGIDPACIRMYLGVLAQNTMAQNAQLHAVPIALKIYCNTCKQPFEITRTAIACPQCGGTDVQVLSGKEFYIDSIEADL